ncbi:MAG: tetratricopeptide repeat protein [Gammaproteobacteria bacterium]|nr:tetratricopeptide repeat protein [Gammaproteobacteria bacterium]
MNDYETEEQQVEAIKKWWNENFKRVIIASLIGLTAIVGVQQWKKNTVVNAQTASVEYDYILNTVKTKKEEVVKKQVESLLDDYSDYPYAALSAMLEATQMINAGHLTEAEKKYQWVIDHSKTQTLQHISRVRLANLMASQGKNEQALKILDTPEGSFKGSYLEIKGDILVALKRIDEARSAYDQALEAYSAIGANAQILKIKRNDLGNS